VKGQVEVEIERVEHVDVELEPVDDDREER
jgi:hypothetical protein